MEEAIARELFGEHGFAIRPEPWMRDAACLEHEHHANDWFATGGSAVERARAVCRKCLCQSACLAHALSEGITEGVWGGATPKERAELLKSGRIDAGLVARWGVHATQGRQFERDYPRLAASNPLDG